MCCERFPRHPDSYRVCCTVQASTTLTVGPAAGYGGVFVTVDERASDGGPDSARAARRPVSGVCRQCAASRSSTGGAAACASRPARPSLRQQAEARHDRAVGPEEQQMPTCLPRVRSRSRMWLCALGAWRRVVRFHSGGPARTPGARARRRADRGCRRQRPGRRMCSSAARIVRIVGCR